MKKKFQAAWLLLMFILVVGMGSVQAAEATINWDVNSNYDGATYSVINGGTLWYFGGSYPYASIISQNASSQVNQAANLTGSFSNNGETTNVSGTAGGSYLDNGLSNTVSAEVIQTGSNIYFDQATQTISSALKRSFSIEPNAEVSISTLLGGDIDALINWALVESGISYSSYNISASVQLLAGGVNDSSIDISDYTKTLILDVDEGETSGSISFISDENVIFYNLITSLTITTAFSNFDSATGETGITLDLSNIGPLTVETTLVATTTPVPGSMFLLFSGFAGLAAVLRRSKN